MVKEIPFKIEMVKVTIRDQVAWAHEEGVKVFHWQFLYFEVWCCKNLIRPELRISYIRRYTTIAYEFGGAATWLLKHGNKLCTYRIVATIDKPSDSWDFRDSHLLTETLADTDINKPFNLKCQRSRFSAVHHYFNLRRKKETHLFQTSSVTMFQRLLYLHCDTYVSESTGEPHHTLFGVQIFQKKSRNHK